MLLAGKRVLVTGILNEHSLAHHVARRAIGEGAAVAATSFGRVERATRRALEQLGADVPLLRLDVTDEADFRRLPDELDAAGFETLDGAVHAVAFSPRGCTGAAFTEAPWADVATTIEISTFSFARLAAALRPKLAASRGAIVGLDFDSSRAWPVYDWMGVAKAGLEATSRYLARDLGVDGVRVNLVASGPVRTTAARSIPEASRFGRFWDLRAPLGWTSAGGADAVGRACVLLLSDWLPCTTGEIVHVDGGAHALGAGSEVEALFRATDQPRQPISGGSPQPV